MAEIPRNLVLMRKVEYDEVIRLVEDAKRDLEAIRDCYRKNEVDRKLTNVLDLLKGE